MIHLDVQCAQHARGFCVGSDHSARGVIRLLQAFHRKSRQRCLSSDFVLVLQLWYLHVVLS